MKEVEIHKVYYGTGTVVDIEIYNIPDEFTNSEDAIKNYIEDNNIKPVSVHKCEAEIDDIDGSDIFIERIT